MSRRTVVLAVSVALALMLVASVFFSGCVERRQPERLFERNVDDDWSHTQVYGGYAVGQSFTVGETGPSEEHSLGRIELKVWRTGSPGSLKLKIYRERDGSPVASGGVDTADVTTEQFGEWLSVSMSPSVTLHPGEKYFMLLSVPQGDQSNYLSVVFHGGKTISGYNLYLYAAADGSDWNVQASQGALTFKEYGRPVSQSDLSTGVKSVSSGGGSGLQISNPSPADGATGVSLQPTLSVDIYNPDGDPLNVFFYNASSGELLPWSSTSYGNATSATVSTTWDASGDSNGCNQYGTTYTWYAGATDGEHQVWIGYGEGNLSFTTEPANFEEEAGGWPMWAILTVVVGGIAVVGTVSYVYWRRQKR